ncbi:MAG: phosphatase PAP2 family protein [Dehalococcoidia bacterium]|nr:phosphatase PAP2 family protein [Dehalococcoidia bacterium]MSQ34503.1 phosphatase PAP2 family protein [Dehalococcoidia bacterium]
MCYWLCGTSGPEVRRLQTKRSLVFLLLGVLVVVAFAGCSSEKKVNASGHSSAIATTWFDGLYGLVRMEKLSPPEASRIFAYTGVALYESVVPGMPGNQSLAGQLNGLPEIPQPKSGEAYHWPTIADASIAAVLDGLFAGAAPSTKEELARLKIDNGRMFAGTVDEAVAQRSRRQGEAVGEAILKWADGDGFRLFNACPYKVPGGIGFWVPTPPGNIASPLQPCWGKMRTFALSSGSEFTSPAPGAYSTDPNSAMYKLALEVVDATKNLTPEQRKIALYWADDPGATGTPPGHSVAIATQLLREKNMALDVAAVAYAKVGMAVADGFISCWNTKYVYNLLRPVTYIRQNIDPNWTPLISTPPFPEYTSGHSVQSGAAAEVLVSVFGDGPFTDKTHVNRGLEARRFSKLSQFADEAAVSRLYGGIHYRPAIEIGVEEGRKIGKKINALKWTK